jgi:16S rRNA (uracil1498-N3)-methyltransferase
MQTSIRLYQDFSLMERAEIHLSAQASHYLLSVMRLKTGERFRLFNGRDGEWCAELHHSHKKQAICLIHQQLRPQTAEHGIKLLFAPIKPHRQAFLVEKATELGVTGLQPILMQHSAIRNFNTDKALAQVIEAAEQSERLTIPKLNPLVPLLKLLSAWPADHTLVVGDERRKAPALKNLVPHLNIDKTSLLIGPEGGFSAVEFKHLEAHPAVKFMQLGPNILRAETAALAAISLFQCC